MELILGGIRLMQSKVRKNRSLDGHMDDNALTADTDWFAEWFDTAWYDEMYAARDDREAQALVALIHRIAPPETAEKVLDLGCGRGRHAIALAKLGYEVHGLDLSDRALEIARERAAAQGLAIRFVKGDMRVPLQERFDMVTSLFTSFGYFESSSDDRLVLESVAQMLKPGGRFVLDFLNPGHVERSLVRSEEKQLRSARVRITRGIEQDEPFPRVVKTMIFTGQVEAGGSSDPARTTGRREFSERVRLYPADWFVRELEALGLDREHVYGGYAGEPYDREVSRRMVQVFRKRGS